MPWLLWKPCTMPHSNYPNDVTFYSIKKTVWRNDHLSEGKIWKFGYDSSGFRKVLEPSQNCFAMLSKIDCCGRFIPLNIGESRQKLSSCSRREADFHDGSSDRIKSASARTESRSYPSPISISLSPLAKSRRISFSCSDFSYASTPIMTAAARPLCVMIMGSLLCRNFFRILAASCLKSLTGRRSVESIRDNQRNCNTK